MNLEQLADPSAAPTLRIFADSAQFDEWLAAVKPLGPLTDRQIEEVVDPQLRAARAVATRQVTATQHDSSTPSQEYAAPAALPGVGPALLSIKEVSELIGKSQSSIHQYVKEGLFPEQLKLGASARWKLTEVLAWIEEQAARRNRS